LTATSSPLLAQQRDPRELEAQELQAQELQAKKACLAGRPDRGIELLAELYAETNDATYIYNQARCYQQNGRAQDAATRFREYLRKSPNIDPAEKTQVQGFITELEAQTRQAPPPAPAAPPQPGAAATATATATATPGVPSVYKWRLAGVLTGSAGVLALLGGVTMGLRARSLTNEITDDGTMNHTFSQSKYDQGRRAETLQWVGYGVGAAALAGGAVLYLLGGRAPEESAGSVTAMPAIAPGQAGGGVRIRF
jgi:tetratricopeptide (TPR) repeat protein